MTPFAGFKAGIESSGIEGRTIETKDVAAQGEEKMRRAADGEFGLVISLEWIQGEPMQRIARDYANTNWVIMNQTPIATTLPRSCSRSTRAPILPER